MNKPSADFFESIMYDLHCQETGRHKARLARQKWFDNICDRALIDLIEQQKLTLHKNEETSKNVSEYELQYYKSLQEKTHIKDLQCILFNNIKKEDTEVTYGI